MNNRVKNPDPPAEWSRHIDYRNELELARFSRVSYLDPAAVSNEDVNPDHAHLLAAELGSARWRSELDFLSVNHSSGFVAYAFANDDQKRAVIAIRGSDNFADWSGPNLALARDSEWLDTLGLPSPVAREYRHGVP